MRRALVMGAIAVVAGSFVFTGAVRAHDGYSVRSLQGSWGFVEEYRVGTVYGSAVGILVFDGKGRCEATFVEHGGAYASGARAGAGRCEYAVESNGMGRLTGDIVDIDFVITDHGRAMRYIHADNQVKGYYGSGEMERM